MYIIGHWFRFVSRPICSLRRSRTQQISSACFAAPRRCVQQWTNHENQSRVVNVNDGRPHKSVFVEIRHAATRSRIRRVLFHFFPIENSCWHQQQQQQQRKRFLVLENRFSNSIPCHPHPHPHYSSSSSPPLQTRDASSLRFHIENDNLTTARSPSYLYFYFYFRNAIRRCTHERAR